MSNSTSTQLKWLNSNHGAIEWRLVGPNIRNRFDSNVTPERLEDYVRDRTALMQECSLQALMDETLILKVTDLSALTFETIHPNLVGIEVQDLQSFFSTHSILEKMTNDFKALQSACEQELKNREADSGSSF